MSETARCKRCKKIKAVSSFSADSSRPTGHFPWCKDCQVAYAADNRFQSEEAPLNGRICPLDDVPIRGHANRRYCSTYCVNRVASLKKKYGLSVPDYRRLVEFNQGRCPICLRKATVWHVDHNHRTRKVAAAVCARCNVGPLAYTYHDFQLAMRLALYLGRTPAEQLGIDATCAEDQKPSHLHKTWTHKPRKKAP